MNKELVTIDDTMKLGSILAKSGFFSDARQEAQAVVKVLAGRELGFGPVTSMMGINIVKGKISLSANLIAASIRKSGRYDYRVVEHTESKCHLDFYQGDTKLGDSIFTVDDAKKAGLVKADSNWQKWPKNMVFARALSNGAKWFCPDVFTTGIYTPDELGAPIDGETGEVVEAEVTEVIDDTDQTQSVPAFDTMEDFLYQLSIDFDLDDKKAKALLKDLGYTGWPKNGGARQKSAEMYLAIKDALTDQDALIETEQAQPYAPDVED